jgi:hypothetical protein
MSRPKGIATVIILKLRAIHPEIKAGRLPLQGPGVNWAGRKLK